MSLWQRARRWWRAQRMSRETREPERTLARLCEAIEQRLAEARAEALAGAEEERRLAALQDDAEWQAARMLRYARRALSLGRAAWAREAVERHLLAVEHARQYADRWQRHHQDTLNLWRLLEVLEIRLAELQQRRRLLVARQHLAHAQQLALEGLSALPSHATIAMTEQRLRAGEDRAASYRSLSGECLAADIDALDRGPTAERVEHLLAQLARELGLPHRTE